jgi:hypothetical protein
MCWTKMRGTSVSVREISRNVLNGCSVDPYCSYSERGIIQFLLGIPALYPLQINGLQVGPAGIFFYVKSQMFSNTYLLCCISSI